MFLTELTLEVTFRLETRSARLQAIRRTSLNPLQTLMEG